MSSPSFFPVFLSSFSLLIMTEIVFEYLEMAMFWIRDKMFWRRKGEGERYEYKNMGLKRDILRVASFGMAMYYMKDVEKVGGTDGHH